MSLLTPAHLHFAELGKSVIALDLKRDRYTRLSPKAADAVRAAIRNETCASHSNRLASYGFLARPGTGRAFALAMPSRPLEAALTGGYRRHASATDIVALATMRARLRVSGLEAVVRAAERRGRNARGQDRARAHALACRFEASRAWVPGGRHCLPDSLALQWLATRSGLACQVVIAVRDHPFSAHCWVQAGDLLMTDSLDIVRELTPILCV